MGLDISAYSKIAFARAYEPAEYAPLGMIRLDTANDFAGRVDGLARGFYFHGPGMLHFPAGSYGGYNNWRKQLCESALGIGPDAIWRATDELYAGKPFVELINFTDCNGVVGPKTSAKLAEDFRANRERITAGWDAWDLGMYDKWTAAFMLAADDGCVIFH